MARERVLVTGCEGFVGRILTGLLEDEGLETWGVDRKGGSRGGHCTTYVDVDLQSHSAVAEMLDRAQPRYIIHLAAQSSGGLSFSRPKETLVNNVVPALNILESLRLADWRSRLLVVGSADVYGPVKPEALPMVETHAANPNNPYALSKAMQEDSSLLYSRIYGVDVVMTRSFNHTGPGRPDTFVLSSFARQIVEAKKGRREPAIDVGDLTVRRDFSDVRDVCRAYALLLREGERGEIYNVCSGVSRSLRDILDSLIELAGVRIDVRVDSERLRPSDMPELRGDNSKLKAATGWVPEIPFTETLRSLLDYWDRELEDSRD